MNLIEESFQRLFPSREFNYETEENYNRQLSDFNANISLKGNKITVKYNLHWKSVDDEIKIGLVQSLLLKLFKVRKSEIDYSHLNINLYNDFVKRIPDFCVKDKTDPLLEESFNRVNEKFFFGVVDQPNLTWGTYSIRKLASYNYHNDTVTVSKVFTNVKQEILDYLMYHELLHKRLKFSYKGIRNSFHTKKFKQAENIYPNKPLIEKEIDGIIKSYKRSKNSRLRKKNSWFSFFK